MEKYDARIAIIVKDRLQSETLQDSLRWEGFQHVFSFSDEEENFPLSIEKNTPNIVVVCECTASKNNWSSIRNKINRLSKIIVITSKPNTEFINKIIETTGMDGIIYSCSGKPEFLFAISEVLRGRKYLSPQLLIDKRKKQTLFEDDNHWDSKAIETLSEREKQVIFGIGMGYTNKQIANQLFLSSNTVNNHRFRIMKKLNIKGFHRLIKLSFWLQNNQAVH
jgi:DNA-binding NarL/FixJ family response regulator